MSADRPLLIQWAFGPEGSVEGFFIKPEPGEPSTKFEKYETQTVLRLPFDGEWFVFWGGRERKHNYHVDYENQRYAYDFLVKVDGATHVGDPKDLDAYHCFGKAILAPAGGNVVVAIDGLPDQVPGEMDPANAAGNHVVIDHGNEEYSLLAHLKEGSVAVSEGDEVAQGQAIGACGNSGNTTEPHLHYHLQNGRAFGEGHGLPTPFTDLVVNGEPSDRAEPVGGDTVSPRQP